jgi:pimeloyl-ACP methyl ester carboxylesterase/DNA-binding CsgD family transcriptional regulator
VSEIAVKDEARGRSELEGAAELLRLAWDGEASPLLDEILDFTSAPGFAEGAAALAPAEAVSLAVLSERNTAIYAEGDFPRWFPDPAGTPDVRRLAADARRRGAALGLLETADGAAVAAWAGCGAAARKWALPEAVRAALAPEGRVLALVFAPSRSSELAARAAAAFGLTPLETRLGEAFLFAPSLEIAAAQAGVGRETARDAMARIMAKTGARRSTEVVRRLAELMSAVQPDAELTVERFAETLGLTRAEAGVALHLASGATQKEAAEALGLRPETVRTYAKQALAKAGVARAKDLARLAAETRALMRLASVAEPVFTRGAPAQLRLMPRAGERRLAFLDYGPRSGRPAIVFHGFVAGRSLPPALARGLQARGLRPIVPQRPGFGLSSEAAGDYLAEAAGDLAALLDALGLDRVALFARDGGTAAALAFAAAHPARVARGVLLNPRSPQGFVGVQRGGPVSRLAQLMLSHPHLVGGIGELIRRRTRSDLLDSALGRTLSAIPADREAMADPAVRAQLIRDIQAQFAHTAAGYIAEHQLYSGGWTAPRLAAGSWTIARSGALSGAPARDPWLRMPGVTFETLEGAGVLAQFTHAEALAALIAAD